LTETTASPVAGSVGGTGTTTTDLDGDVTGYTDVWGTATTNTYNVLGQLTETVTTPPGGSGRSEYFTYDVDGNLVKVTKSGTTATIAQSTYTNGQLTQVAYPLVSGGGNGATGTLTYGPTGAQSGLAWGFTGSQNGITDNVVRSQTGRILTDTITDGTTAYNSSYTYDTAGRLVQATIPYNQLAYGFGTTTGTCGTGTDTNAGENGNRTSYSDQVYSNETDTTTSGAAFTTGYCYDNTDRLTSTTVTNPPTGADPLEAAGVSETATTPTIAYDSHGNTTTLADQTMTYDGADQLTGVTSTGNGVAANSATISYVRDATGRVVQETTTVAGGTASTLDYGYDATGDSADWVLSTSNTVEDHLIDLPGGATVDIQASGAWTWSLPNLQGSSVVTTNESGTRSSSIALYDPFGNPINMTTHQIGTLTADDAVPNDTTETGSMSLGWQGSHTKLYDHPGDIADIEMGARQYLSVLGRFLQVDAVAGGNSNDYNYPNDPINDNDLTGRSSILKWWNNVPAPLGTQSWDGTWNVRCTVNSLRHIQREHADDWKELQSMGQLHRRDLFDWSVETTLRHPENKLRPQRNGNTVYTHTFFIEGQYGVDYAYKLDIVVNRDGELWTAFPHTVDGLKGAPIVNYAPGF
jgi:RHS repeat-associated protein